MVKEFSKGPRWKLYVSDQSDSEIENKSDKDQIQESENESDNKLEDEEIVENKPEPILKVVRPGQEDPEVMKQRYLTSLSKLDELGRCLFEGST